MPQIFQSTITPYQCGQKSNGVTAIAMIAAFTRYAWVEAVRPLYCPEIMIADFIRVRFLITFKLYATTLITR
jgi:hypothetical protein